MNRVGIVLLRGVGRAGSSIVCYGRRGPPICHLLMCQYSSLSHHKGKLTYERTTQQRRTKVTSSYVSTLSSEDWDVVPKNEWNLDMCIQWLQDEVAWNKDNIKAVRSWLEKHRFPGKCITAKGVEDACPTISLNDIEVLDMTLERLQPPGLHAEPLKRWAECVSRGEEEIKTVEEYNTMKHTCDKVMVLRYSQLVQELDEADKNSFALMQQKLQQLCIDDKGGPAVSASEYDMEVRILPKHLKWPSFFVSKQNDAGNTHVLLRRIQPPVQDLESATKNALCSDDVSKSANVIWTGAAGIGKSTYGNVVAEQLVKQLNTSIGVLAWRIDTFVYLISKSVSGGIRIDGHRLSCVHDLMNYADDIKKRRGVLIVELEENDILPSFSCRLLCSSSVKDIAKIFKEQFKQKYVMYNLNCYELWEVQAAANMLYATGDRVLDEDRMVYAKKAIDRYEKVGGLPRFLFCADMMFEGRLHAMNKVNVNEAFVQFLNDSNTDKLSGDVKYFLTPIHTNPRTWHFLAPQIRLRFLSIYCEELIMKRLSDLGIEKIRTAPYWQPMWMLEESLMRTSLSANPMIVESELSIHRAEWFIDPGHNVKLSAQSKPADAAFVSSIPLYTKIDCVQEGISKGCVKTKYKQGVLYCAVADLNMVVADCFMVDHNNRRVLLYQASMSAASQHPFRETNIRNYIDAMELADCDYKLCVVYVRGNHHGNDTGLTFIADDGKAGDLSEELKTRVETYVVRANYFKDRYVLLPGYLKPLPPIKEVFSLVVRSDRDTNEDKMVETSALLDLDITSKTIYKKITKDVVIQYLESLDIQNGGKKEVVVHRFNEYLKRFKGVLIACQHGDADQITAALRDFNSHLTAKEAIVTNIKRLPKSTRDKCCTVLGIDVGDISGLYETLKTAP